MMAIGVSGMSGGCSRFRVPAQRCDVTAQLKQTEFHMLWLITRRSGRVQ